MDKTKIQTKTVWSATNFYLGVGIAGIILFLFVEGSVIYSFFASSLQESIGIGLIMQLPALMCLFLTTTIKDWKNRTKFNIYYIKLKTDTDIDYIKENYSVEDISTRGILFVEKDDSHNFRTWKLLQGYQHMWEIEERWFNTETDDVPVTTKPEPKCYSMEAKSFEKRLNDIGITYDQFIQLRKIWNELTLAAQAEVNDLLRQYED